MIWGAVGLEAVTKDDEYWMSLALKMAKKAALLGEVPVGALVVKDNQLIAKAFNRRETWRTPIGHAEVIAIQRASQKLASWRLTGCTLYVTLEPCVMCAGALVQSRVDRLVYGASDAKGGAVNSLYQITTDSRLNHQIQVVPDVMQTECQKLLSDFFKDLRASKKVKKLNV